MCKNRGRTSAKSLIVPRMTTVVAVCKRKKESLLRTPFLANYQGYALGFMEFITEDELQEHAGESPRIIFASMDPRCKGRIGTYRSSAAARNTSNPMA